jgi:type IV secretion system protein VirB10
MQEPEAKGPITVPEQPNTTIPLKKGLPIVLALGGIVLLFGIVSLLGLISGRNRPAATSSLTMRPTTVNPQQVAGFQSQQDIEDRRDAEERARRQLAAQFQDQSSVPGPEATTAAPMTAAQARSIYGNSPNAPTQTSGTSEAQAEAKQRVLAREKQRQDALNSGTVAIDFAHQTAAAAPQSPTAVSAAPAIAPNPAVVPPQAYTPQQEAGDSPDAPGAEPQRQQPQQQPGDVQPAATTRPESKDPLAAYPFDAYSGQLYRVFEGTVLEGVVTNHIDGGFNGPILVMLTTDYYSHDHQQLLLPQGTRIIGTVGAVNSGQQRKLMVTFHRAVCPDGFSIDIDHAPGLDQVGTTGLATNVNHGYLSMFTAAAAIGGLGGLAQIGNSASVLDPSAQIRNGISSETAMEAEQVLNHFLNRLPIITLKEGSRARVYIGRDILIPAYAEHRVNPTL